MHLSFLPEQLVRSSQQLVFMDTKRVFSPCNMKMEARNIYGISAATATIGHGVPLWSVLT